MLLLSRSLLPFLIWIWWGVALTIIDYILNGDCLMSEPQTVERARLFRYTDLAHTPPMLSWLEPDRNVLHIDRVENEKLPRFMQDYLLSTDKEFTRVHESGLKFVDYHTR